MKKDKKAPEDTLNPDEEALNKDYQQEEDEDVKEKHKITKVIIAIILFIVIVFILLLIRNIHEKTKEQKYDVNGVVAADSVVKAEEGTGEEVDGCLLDLSGPVVVVTIPLKFYEDKQPADTLTEAEQANGYVDVEKAGGNVIYTIKTSYYPSIVSNLYENHSDEYQKDAFLEDNNLLRFAQYSYMQKFTVTIDDSKPFIPDKYYKLLKHTYCQSAIYQSYLGIAPADIKVNFQFKYIGAQFPFVEYEFPTLLGRSLASVPYSIADNMKPNSAVKKFGFDS